MKKVKNYGPTAYTLVCMLILSFGCAERYGARAKSEIKAGKVTKTGTEIQKQTSTVQLALKFNPHESTTYKVTAETGRQAIWEGLSERKPAEFKGGHSGNKMEMTFEQHIQSIDNNGNAVAKITINGLIYQTEVTDNIVLDFDSSRKDDMKGPLGKLIGKSYTIEITPTGQVSKIIDVNDIMAAISNGAPADKTAIRLLSVSAIKARHTIPGLPAGQEEFGPGQSWDDAKSFYFDQMGTKSYNKTYTLEDIKDAGKSRVAVIRMNAIPSAEQAREEPTTLPFPFDSTETYTGQTKLNLSEGKVEQCSEKLLTEWIIVDPASAENERPDAIKMSALNSYDIERID